MANTLNQLIPDLYQAVDIVSRELTGLIPSVTVDAQAERAALGEEVISPVTQAQTASDVTPGVVPPDDGDQTIDNEKVVISKSRRVPVRWNGEQTRGVNNGVGISNILRDQFAQAMRTLANEVEADLAGLYKRASRAVGTSGTTPFGSDMSETALVRKILVDNGAPTTDLQLVIDTTAGANLRSLANLTDADRAGTTQLREQGILLPINGFMIRESAQINAHTKGTGASYLVNGAQLAGDTAIEVDTGTGTILDGDIVNFGAGSDLYVVGSALAGGQFLLNKPGLISDVADNTAVALQNSYRANLAFSRSAIQLVTRAPALPEAGDMADDRMIITDPVSGLSFEIAMYRQYRQVQYEVSLAWGVACTKPEHLAILIG